MGNSLAAQGLGFGAFSAVARVQSLVGEPRSRTRAGCTGLFHASGGLDTNNSQRQKGMSVGPRCRIQNAAKIMGQLECPGLGPQRSGATPAKVLLEQLGCSQAFP